MHLSSIRSEYVLWLLSYDVDTASQVVIFVKSVTRANELDKLLRDYNFPSICIHSGLAQEERCVLPKHVC